jgi:hypothetical protein
MTNPKKSWTQIIREELSKSAVFQHSAHFVTHAAEIASSTKLEMADHEIDDALAILKGGNSK